MAARNVSGGPWLKIHMQSGDISKTYGTLFERTHVWVDDCDEIQSNLSEAQQICQTFKKVCLSNILDFLTIPAPLFIFTTPPQPLFLCT